ncbi:DegT/DnrJ/EryC1/StrS family aminotransferase [Pseudomonas sp. CDFA 602]|uniref:DegT/DnrJ/EryC1/StrS family aminotransferase n=1 Tax=Pseudomonas californiensis TaxID=2829823 RepID=UPI001E47D09F|nr:DegT/DnrJ/EryC1/StrS family aminotransferase [Pseudomonas californiensis]MCD5996857.1 DegT/DnrJ/EryC1/StrS family aminotransferase [Pseudomonas californiensis]MCD5998332.1 DegT/DnrJ/EryC1/StrS family aminotransferase [Pseudomonas californiensis]
MDKIIPVTSPLLPPLEEFIPYLEQIWHSKQLTNNGPFHQQLETALADHLGVRHLSLFNNGTTALITALQALEIKDEVITTPYSFVATAHALVWNRLTPVFVDIDPLTFNIDPNRIEAAITSKTTAIMPVHCYGNPCDTDAIQAIADKHDLRVIYDAAHAFGVKDANGSVLRHGDLSVLSLHATKVFNTFEGGAIISPDAETKEHVDQLRNFGFVDEVTVVTAGINGKMNEISSAFGLLQLQYIDQALQRRESIDDAYRTALAATPGIRLHKTRSDCVANHAYLPMIVEDDYPLDRDELYEALKEQNIFARRYFYPLITHMSAYQEIDSMRRHPTPEAEKVARKVICLPIYPDLQAADIERVVSIIRERGRNVASEGVSYT